MLSSKKCELNELKKLLNNYFSVILSTKITIKANNTNNIKRKSIFNLRAEDNPTNDYLDCIFIIISPTDIIKFVEYVETTNTIITEIELNIVGYIIINDINKNETEYTLLNNSFKLKKVNEILANIIINNNGITVVSDIPHFIEDISYDKIRESEMDSAKNNSINTQSIPF